MYKLIAKIVSHPIVSNYLLNRAKKTPYSNIYGIEDGELYMERYWLFNAYPESGGKRKFEFFPLAMRIHKIVKPDNDRPLHDHPWNARTFILKGWYKEKRLNCHYERKEGDTSRLNFGEYHQITEVCEEGVYTLFVTGRYQGTWGFLVNGIKINYKKYLGLNDE